MLLNGIPPKEIAHNLDLKYNSLLYHQKEIYRKLDVHSVRELIEKYAPVVKSESEETVQEGLITSIAAGRWLDKRQSGVKVRKNALSVAIILGIILAVVILFLIRKPTNAPVLDEGFPAVFNSWSSFKDEVGSSINVTVTPDDIIDGKAFTSYTMSGGLSGEEGWHFAGMPLYPVPLTHQAMKEMTYFSFKVLGDGKPYMVFIPTTDTHLYNVEYDHYRIMFSTVNGQISTVTINVDDLLQAGNGIQVPFIRDNILHIEFFIDENLTPDSFNLKVWDIRIFYK